MKHREIKVTVHVEKHRWGDTVILEGSAEDRSLETIKTRAQPGEIVPGRSYQFFGSWVDHPKYGPQFHAQTFIETEPADYLGVVKYLEKAPGIGRKLARRLWDAYGPEAVRKLREVPVIAAADIRGLGRKAALEAHTWLEDRKDQEDCSIKLVGLLAGYGFPRDLHKALKVLWGNRAAGMIRRNPYLLMRFPRCGFARCDRLYMDLGHDPNRLKRQALCAWYGMASDTNGHTWHSRDFVERILQARIDSTRIQGPKALRLARRAGLLAICRDPNSPVSEGPLGAPYFAEFRKAESEGIVASRAADMMAGDVNWWVGGDHLQISPHQYQELSRALQGQLALFGGGPGTGKTYTVARLIKYLVGRFGSSMVAVAAPTGKAAIRLHEILYSHDCNVGVSTIHSLLGVEALEGGGWRFLHNEDNPLPCRFLFVDEVSMTDTDLLAALFRGCAPTAHILLVGDIHQLPPVGHGAPLRDLIRAGAAYGQLSEIQRNAGTIVRACAEIRAGRRFTVDSKLQPDSGQNLKLLETANNEHSAAEIVTLFRRLPVADRVWDAQLVVAVNRKSPLSRRAMNRELQRELNPDGKGAEGNPFLIGDKAVNTRNGFFLDEATDEATAWVANGELGKVVDVRPKLTVIKLDAPERLIKVPRGDSSNAEEDETGTGCTWDLGYALSVHKSQGSEWPVVIVALDEYPGARMVCSREWLYTAVSRPKRAGILVGKMQTAMAMVKRPALDKRKTFLVERIKCLIAKSS